MSEDISGAEKAVGVLYKFWEEIHNSLLMPMDPTHDIIALEVEVPIAIEVVVNLNVDNAGAHKVRGGRKKRTAEEHSSDNHAENKMKNYYKKQAKQVRSLCRQLFLKTKNSYHSCSNHLSQISMKIN